MKVRGFATSPPLPPENGAALEAESQELKSYSSCVRTTSFNRIRTSVCVIISDRSWDKDVIFFHKICDRCHLRFFKNGAFQESTTSGCLHVIIYVQDSDLLS